MFIIDPKRISERGKTFEWEKNEVVAELKEKGIIGAAKDSFYCSYHDKVHEMSVKKLISLDVLSHSSTDFKYKTLKHSQLKQLFRSTVKSSICMKI